MPDSWLSLISVIFLSLSLLMVTSASLYTADQYGVPIYHYALRQGAFIGVGLIIAYFAYKISLERWYRITPHLIFFTFLLLVLVLIPGIGREVNGAMRWIPIGPVNLQPAELAKLLSLIYIAGYLHRHNQALKSSTFAMVAPLFVLGFIGAMLLLEPDFGSTVIIFSIGLGMIFLAGVCLYRFLGMLLLTIIIMVILLFSSPYRVTRLMFFRYPWDDPFNQGYQLTNSLMAIGNGKLGGAGLGESIQKLGYLPEAHTDFIFSIYAEEFGFFGVVILIALFTIFVLRAFRIGALAEEMKIRFGAYLAYGIGLWFGAQAFIHMAVTMGLLPTKGLTLPLISYGGSSIITMLVALAILFRVDIDAKNRYFELLEQYHKEQQKAKERESYLAKRYEEERRRAEEEAQRYLAAGVENE